VSSSRCASRPVDGGGSGRFGRRRRSVQEAQRFEAVLQEVAQHHRLHLSLLTRWRAQHQAVAKKATRREARLLPVRVQPRARPHARFAQRGRLSESSARLGTIEVEFSAGWRVHIQGVVDARTLRGAAGVVTAMIAVPTGVRIWLAGGFTDLRKYARTIVMQIGRWRPSVSAVFGPCTATHNAVVPWPLSTCQEAYRAP
jgi:transposase-like protein